jgi:hypothetical protein
VYAVSLCKLNDLGVPPTQLKRVPEEGIGLADHIPILVGAADMPGPACAASSRLVRPGLSLSVHASNAIPLSIAKATVAIARNQVAMAALELSELPASCDQRLRARNVALGPRAAMLRSASPGRGAALSAPGQAPGQDPANEPPTDDQKA